MEALQRGNIRLAATVVLVRDAPAGVEVFMVQRPGTVDFPNLHVFPGGKLDASDHMPELCTGMEDARASDLLGVSAGGLRYWVAAIRECFEECGVLLATSNDETLAIEDGAAVRRFTRYRGELLDGRMSLADVCEREKLRLACQHVGYFSHWLTPDAALRRFDTRFFVAAMPPGQTAVAHEWETQDSSWTTPGAALECFRDGAWQMISPTLTTLEMIVPYSDCESLLQAVATEAHVPELTPELNVQGMQPMR